jgi:hypothetical protein
VKESLYCKGYRPEVFVCYRAAFSTVGAEKLACSRQHFFRTFILTKTLSIFYGILHTFIKFYFKSKKGSRCQRMASLNQETSGPCKLVAEKWLA